MGLIFDVAAQTALGSRAENTDFHAVSLTCGVAAVLDGGQSPQGGATASHLAADVMLTSLQQNSGYWRSAAADVVCQYMIHAVFVANDRTRIARRTHVPNKDMCAALSAIAFRHDIVCIVHVGHGRVYRLRDGALAQLPADRMPAGAVGLDDKISVETFVGERREGDVYLAATDGVTRVVDDEMIAELLRVCADPRTAAKAIIECAVQRRTPDNATAVVLRGRDG